MPGHAIWSWWLPRGAALALSIAGCAREPLVGDGDGGDGAMDGGTIAADAASGSGCGSGPRSVGAAPCTPTPTALAAAQPSPAAIAVDATSVYWINSGEHGAVMKVLLTGGAPVMLASASGGAGIAVDGSSVYWTNIGRTDGPVMKVPRDGGPAVALATSQPAAVGIAVDANNVYWSDIMGAGVVKASLCGGPPVALAPPCCVFNLAIDATSVYFHYWNGSNGSPIAIRKVPIAGGPTVTLADGQRGASGIAVDATSVYWNTVSGVVKMPLSGGAVQTVVSVVDVPTDLALDETSVYFRSFADGTVRKAPIGGGSSVVLASGQKFPQSLAPLGNGIAVDRACVYWTDGVPDGHVMMVAR
jgi:hypothetical protein